MAYRSLLLALGALAACGPSDAAKRPAAPVRTTSTVAPVGRPDTGGLARDIPRLLQVSGIPGLSIAVVQDGRVVWSGAFGTVNDSARTALDPETVFEAASLSKPVFAYIVLRLADRGELDLDRPLFELLEYPRLAGDARYRRITARMVLSHGTGLPNWGGETLALAFEPGTAYGYSGEGFLYLQKVVERVTGLSLDELARREVFEPLGMTRSGYVWHDRFAGHAAYARDWLWNVASVNHYTDGEANAAASLLTTAPDYARFVAALMAGRGLSPALWKAFLTPVHETGPGISMALGVRVEDGTAGRIFYHSGNNGRRFTCYMTGDIGRRLGFVYFTGAPNGTSLVAPLASHVFGDERPARHRSDFDGYDDPRLMALRSVERAAAERGAAAAQDRLRAIGATPATRPTFDATLELGAFFAGRGLSALAIEVLRQAVADAPDSGGGPRRARPGAGVGGRSPRGDRGVSAWSGARGRGWRRPASAPLGRGAAGGARASRRREPAGLAALRGPVSGARHHAPGRPSAPLGRPHARVPSHADGAGPLRGHRRSGDPASASWAAAPGLHWGSSRSTVTARSTSGRDRGSGADEERHEPPRSGGTSGTS